MTKNKTTHIRVEKNTLLDMRKSRPDSSFNEIIKDSWAMYKGVQKAGKFMYGSVWKTRKK